MTNISHPVLDRFDAIAWDMDGTLVQNHFDAPNAEFFLAYIAAHPEKRHIILTFRNKSWADEIYDELAAHGLDSRKLIAEVISCPEKWHDIYMMQKRYGTQSCITQYGLKHEDIEDALQNFPRFKGMAAKEAGCGVLVDDLPDWVVTGCQENGIVFLHAHKPCPAFETEPNA